MYCLTVLLTVLYSDQYHYVVFSSHRVLQSEMQVDCVSSPAPSPWERPSRPYTTFARRAWPRGWTSARILPMRKALHVTTYE